MCTGRGGGLVKGMSDVGQVLFVFEYLSIENCSFGEIINFNSFYSSKRQKPPDFTILLLILIPQVFQKFNSPLQFSRKKAWRGPMMIIIIMN